MSTKALMIMSEKEMRNARVRGIFSRIKTSVVVAMTTMMLSMMFAMAAFAEPTTTAPSGGNNYVETTTKTAWNKLAELIMEWVPRIGVVVIVIGAIEFGFAFKSEDAEGKTKALRTVAAGAIVGAVVFGLGNLMKIN